MDGRDYSRLADFFPSSELEAFGFALKDGSQAFEPRPWMEEEVKAQLASDVAFGFEKALDCRGISASMMYEVVKMWMWVLEDPLANFDSYPMYGLPLFKAVAIKYGLPNPIGDAAGDEGKFSE